MPYDALTINAYLTHMNDAWLGAPPGMLTAIATKESGYDPDTGVFNNRCNWLGACGLMQLRPNAIADIKRVYGWNIIPLDPLYSIIGAAMLFKINEAYLMRAGFSPDWESLIIAYNGGWTRGRNYLLGKAIPRESVAYLQFVTDRLA